MTEELGFIDIVKIALNDLVVPTERPWDKALVTNRFKNPQNETKFLSHHYSPHLESLTGTVGIGLVLVLLSIMLNEINTNDTVLLIGMMGMIFASVLMLVVDVVVTMLLCPTCCGKRRGPCLSWSICLGNFIDIAHTILCISVLVSMYLFETGSSFARSETSLPIGCFGIIMCYRLRVVPCLIFLALVSINANLVLVLYSLGINGWSMTALETELQIGVADVLVYSIPSTARIVFSLFIAWAVEATSRTLLVSTQALKTRTQSLKNTYRCQRALIDNVCLLELTENSVPKGVFNKTYDKSAVLVNDIEGFTNYSQNLTANAVIVFLNKLYSAFDRCAASRGLLKVKTSGDSWVGVVCTQEAAYTCVVAACEMLSQFNGICDGLEIKLRTGVAVDKVRVISFWTDQGLVPPDIIGEAAEEAARLERLAQPGQVLCCQRAHDDLVNTTEFNFSLVDNGMWSVRIVIEEDGFREPMLSTEHDDDSQQSDERCAKCRSTTCALLSFLFCCYRTTVTADRLYALRLPMLRICFAAAIGFPIVCLVTLLSSGETDALFCVLASLACATVSVVASVGLVLSSVSCCKCSIPRLIVLTFEFVTFGLLHLVGLLLLFREANVIPLTVSAFSVLHCIVDVQITATMYFPSVPVPVKALAPAFMLVPAMLGGIPYGRLPFHAFDATMIWVVEMIGVLLYSGYVHFATKSNQRAEELLVHVNQSNKKNSEILTSVIPKEVALELTTNPEVGTGCSYTGAIMYVMLNHSRPDSIVRDIKKLDNIIRSYPEVTPIKTKVKYCISVTGIKSENSNALTNITLAASQCARDIPHLRVGVHYGEFTGGILGLKTRRFDVIGDAVNVAARLAQRKDMEDDRVLFSGAFVSALVASADIFEVVERQVALYGRDEKVDVYRMMNEQ